MADQTVIEELVVKFSTKMDEFISGMEKMNAHFAKAEEAADKAKEKVRTWEEAVTKAVGKAGAAFSHVKASWDLMKVSAETAGQAMSRIGTIAESLPGPWGKAANAILTV